MKDVIYHSRNTSARQILLFSFFCSVIVLSSCDSARRVPQGQYLLTHNTIIYSVNEGKGKVLKKEITATKQQIANLAISADIAPDVVLTYVKQKPNTKILGLFPFHLYLYNSVNPEKALEKKIERDQKIDERNKKRIAKGKTPWSDDKIKRKKERRTFREWIMSVGEAPVILDSSLMNSSLKQISLFLHNKGYFDCKVHDSVKVDHKKARVFYIIRQGTPYRIGSLKYQCLDTAMLRAIYNDTVNCLINRGTIFDEDIFLKERDRLTYHLNNVGYYAFSKLYIHYDIDSTAGHHLWNVTIAVNRYAKQDSLNPDSTIEMSHPIFRIRRVIVQMQYNPSNPTYSPSDTSMIGNYIFVYPFHEMGFSPSRLLQKIFVKKGDLYRVSEVDYTYTGLAQLKAFRYVSVKFNAVGDSLLDCYIQLMPTIRQSIGIETVGQNTGGDLGIQGDILYENKNLFNGGEIFQFKLKGGLEAQKLVGNGSSTQQASGKGLASAVQLNTIDFGPELDFSVPRPLLWFNLLKHLPKFGLWPKSNPQTVFKIFYDYQRLPADYARSISGGAFTFNYDPAFDNKDLRLWNIEFKIPEVSYVQATLFQNFQQQLYSTNNFFLINSFNNHYITDIGVTTVFNNQNLLKRHDFFYVKLAAEEAGGLLWLYDTLAKKQFTIANNVPYSLYVKEEVDLRYYHILDKDEKLAFRLYAGLGQPLLKSSPDMPFDKSFWGGGANDIRGWEPRTLGPGGYNQLIIVDQIGDIKLEANAEYRVNVIRYFGLAAFVDAGNIWLIHNNPAVPNGNFVWSGPDAFYNQIAVATGVGIRFDFTYFVFRFDVGVPLVDPARGSTWAEHWAASHEVSYNRSVFNIGIGYPF
jgi:hypothetical protein